MKQLTSHELKDFMMQELGDLGIWLYNSAITTSSHYLKFRDRRLGSLTIRDHPGRKKYYYKWNLIVGYQGERIIKKDGITRYFHSEESVLLLILHIRQYAAYMDRLGPELEWSEKRRKRGRKQKVQEANQ